MSITHHLKIDPGMFTPILLGTKTCEIRFNDRDFQAGDVLFLRETRHTGKKMSEGAPLEYTGREIRQTISHVFRGPALGVMEGWAVLSFKTERHHKLEIQYIGAVALLGRLSAHIEDQEDLCCIEMAMNDLVSALPGRFEVVECTRGWSLEPVREKKEPG